MDIGGTNARFDGALPIIDGANVSNRDAPSIAKAAIDGKCDLSRAALDMFCALLGKNDFRDAHAIE
jgi:glucokinase